MVFAYTLSGEAMRSIALAAVLMTWISIGYSQSLTTTQARAHDGESAKVCGTVGNEHTAMTSQGKPTFIDLDSAFPEQRFALLVWDEDRENVGELPRVGAHICAKGMINYYHGVPQIVIKNSNQLSR
jgi:hypothetical protein